MQMEDIRLRAERTDASTQTRDDKHMVVITINVTIIIINITIMIVTVNKFIIQQRTAWAALARRKPKSRTLCCLDTRSSTTLTHAESARSPCRLHHTTLQALRPQMLTPRADGTGGDARRGSG